MKKEGGVNKPFTWALYFDEKINSDANILKMRRGARNCSHWLKLLYIKMRRCVKIYLA